VLESIQLLLLVVSTALGQRFLQDIQGFRKN